MYAVVEFNEKENGGGLAAVHKSWFTPLKRKVLWPPYKEQQKFDKALRSGETPDQKTWNLFNIHRIFYETDDILKVRRKLKEAEFHSNLESDQDESANAGRQKRHPKKNRRYYVESSDDETGDNDNDQLPRPPPVKKSLLNPIRPGYSEKVRTPSPCRLQSRASTNIFRASLTSPAEEQISTIHNNPEQNTNTLNKLVNLVSHIKKQNDQILTWISKQNVNVANVVEFGLPVEMPYTFPIGNVEDLEEFNLYITENVNKFTELATYLTTLGGSTITSKTNKIFKFLMVDQVTTQYNYYGQRSQKRAFSDLTLKKLIVGAVKKSIPNTTDKEIEDAIKVWLKHAQDRLRKKDARKD